MIARAGDVIYLNAMGQPIVILNNPSIAAELLDRRASIYSDRPTLIVMHEIMCGGLLFLSAYYGDMYVLCAPYGYHLTYD